MQDIEPYYHWREYYNSEEDVHSPFYGRTYSEFEYSSTIYNYFIHPQWDAFDSNTLYLKILCVDYEQQFAILEFIGEWNDALHNDVMYLKRNVIDPLLKNGIQKFIFIGENVLNFHSSDDCYYEEWADDIADGWIAFINFRQHVEDEIIAAHIDQYVLLGAPFNNMHWRKYKPHALVMHVENMLHKRLYAAG